MKTYDTPETIRANALAKAEKEIAEAEIAARIAASLPESAEMIHAYPLYKSIGSVKYSAKTKQEAYEIYKKFDVIPSYKCRKSNSTAIKCFDDESADEVSEFHASVVCDKYHAKLEFFINSEPGIVRVDIEMPLSLFGQYVKDSPNARTNYKLQFKSLPKTLEMHLVIAYAAASFWGEYSAGQKVFALYDKFEVQNQFEAG